MTPKSNNCSAARNAPASRSGPWASGTRNVAAPPDQEARRQRFTQPKSRGRAPHAQRAQNRRDSTDGENRPQHAGSETKSLDAKQHNQRAYDAALQAQRHFAYTDRSQSGIADDGPQSLQNFPSDIRHAVGWSRTWLWPANPEQKKRRDQERCRINRCHDNRRERLSNPPAKAESSDLRDRCHGRQSAVRLDQLP